MDFLKIFGRFKISDQAFYAGVFLVLFLIGIVGGRSIGMITLSIGSSQKDFVDDSASRINNGQQNLLVITVDQMAFAKPALESIWLLITYPEISNLTLVPIYPSTQEDSKTADLELAQTFAMTAQQTPHSEFLELLREKIYLDNYLILDQKGVSSVLRILHQFAEGLPGKENQTNSILLPQSGQRVDRSLENQVQIWYGICLELTRISKAGKIEGLIQKISPHVLTDLKWEKYSQQWSFEQPKDIQIGCEFPTLILNSP
jgi:hypothetical protein